MAFDLETLIERGLNFYIPSSFWPTNLLTFSLEALVSKASKFAVYIKVIKASDVTNRYNCTLQSVNAMKSSPALHKPKY